MPEAPDPIDDALQAVAAVPTQGGRSDQLADLLGGLSGSVLGVVGQGRPGLPQWRQRSAAGPVIIEAETEGDADED